MTDLEIKLPAGFVIGSAQPNITIRKSISRGGCGRVYRADHSRHGKIAVKLPRRFRDVGYMLQDLRWIVGKEHPHMVEILEMGVFVIPPNLPDPLQTMEGLSVPWIAMPYYDDRLGARIGVSPIDPKRSLIWTQQMSTVLRDLEIIHRDLKPDNLFSRTTEHGKDIVVGDFGLSVPSRQDIRRLADIRTNQQCGTPTYMSPEQFDADLDFDVRSDIYTMGLILYEMIKGHQARHLKNEEMDDLDKCFDACFPEGKRIPDPMDIEDPHIRDLIGIMTDPAVNNRYSDHDAVIAAIDRILHAS